MDGRRETCSINLLLLPAVKQRERVRREGGRPEATVQMELIYDA